MDRFAAKVDVRPGGCWLWSAAVDKTTGYGKFYADGKVVNAHRWAYLNLVGPIPDGYTVDHLCRVRRCVRPSHLEAVTARENLLRGDTLTAAHHEGRDCGSVGCKNCQRFRVAS